NSYATGSVSGNNATFAGGFVGQSLPGSSIVNAYATGAVAGDRVGGFVGDESGEIINAYAAGAVTGGSIAGGFAGNVSGTIGRAYWNEDRAGTGTVGVGAGSTGGVTGLSGSQPYTASSYGFTFTGTRGAGGDNWIIVDTDGSLNNAGGAAGATMPMLASEAQSIIQNGHQLQLIDSTGSFTLARSIDAGATGTSTSGKTGADVWGCSGAAASAACAAGFAPLASGFFGTFDGAGHTIANLTIDTTGIGDVGLFAAVAPPAVIKDVGLIGGSVTADAAAVDVGGLAGSNANGATISNAFNTGSVTGGTFTGGLVGSNDGTISQSHANGPVTAGDGGNVGGLVGNNSGSIDTSFAGGAVTTAGGRVGGLVGQNTGQITDTYAVGAVTVTGGIAGSAAGGLVGFNVSGEILDGYATGAVSASGATRTGGLVAANAGNIVGGYWDTGTTGQSALTGGVPMTTQQLQATSGVAGAFDLATDFLNPGNWGIVA